MEISIESIIKKIINTSVDIKIYVVTSSLVPRRLASIHRILTDNYYVFSFENRSGNSIIISGVSFTRISVFNRATVYNLSFQELFEAYQENHKFTISLVHEKEMYIMTNAIYTVKRNMVPFYTFSDSYVTLHNKAVISGPTRNQPMLQIEAKPEDKLKFESLLDNLADTLIEILDSSYTYAN